MTTVELLNTLTARGVTLRVLDGRIVATPKGVVPDELKRQVAEHKPALLRLLTPVGQLHCGDCRQVVDLLPHPDHAGWLRFACGHRRILREEYERWVRLMEDWRSGNDRC